MRAAVWWAFAAGVGVLSPAQSQTRPFFDVPVSGVMDHAFTPDDQLFVATASSVVQFDIGSCVQVDTVVSGSNQVGIDASPSGRHLAVADRALVNGFGVVRVIDRYAGLVPRAIATYRYVPGFGESGSWMPAWLDDERFVVSTAFVGSGSTPLRPVSLQGGFGAPWERVRQEAMLARGGKWLFAAEPNSSAGEVSVWAEGRKIAVYPTNWFVWEVAVSRDGRRVMVPTYDGARVLEFDGVRLGLRGILGQYADNGPIGGAFSADGSLLFTASWTLSASSPLGGVRVYRTKPLALVEVMDGVRFQSTGNRHLGPGRVTLSSDGTWLAVTLPDRVRVYDVRQLVEPGSVPRRPCTQRS